MSTMRRAELADGQNPFGIILGCSDSRVPAEIVFDQGLGDLFVIRVAGNIVGPSQLGSIEFACQRFGARLVVVLGHTSCGAVEATLEAMRGQPASTSHSIMSIVERIRPAVEPLARALPDAAATTLMASAVRANVQAAVGHVRHGTPALQRFVLDSELIVVGAEYDLASGKVEFLDF